jgi:hypothetical protein
MSSFTQFAGLTTLLATLAVPQAALAACPTGPAFRACANAELDELRSLLLLGRDQVIALQDRIVQLEADNADLQTQLDLLALLEDRVSFIEDDYALDSTVTAIDDALQAVEADYATGTALAAAEAAISSLQVQQDVLGTSLATLQSDVDGLPADSFCEVSTADHEVFLTCPTGLSMAFDCTPEILPATSCAVSAGLDPAFGEFDCNDLIDGLYQGDPGFGRFYAVTGDFEGDWIRLDYDQAVAMRDVFYETDWFTKRPREVNIWVSDSPTDLPHNGATLVHTETGIEAVGVDGDDEPLSFSFPEATGQYWYFELEDIVAGSGGLFLTEISVRGAGACRAL